MEKEHKTLFEGIERDSTRLKAAFRDYQEERTDLFEKLLAIARMGFCGSTPDVTFARSHYQWFKGEVIVASNKVRKQFLIRTLWWSFGTLALTAVIYAMLLMMHTSVFADPSKSLHECFVPIVPTSPGNPAVNLDSSKNNPADNLDSLSNKSSARSHCTSFPTNVGIRIITLFFPGAENGIDNQWKDLVLKQQDSIRKASTFAQSVVLTIAGCAIGIALMGFMRNREITYENFDRIYQYGMSPLLYLIFIGVLAMVVLISVSFKVILLGIGSVDLSLVLEKPSIGIMIGLLCSISEPLVASVVADRLKPADSTKT